MTKHLLKIAISVVVIGSCLLLSWKLDRLSPSSSESKLKPKEMTKQEELDAKLIKAIEDKQIVTCATLLAQGASPNAIKEQTSTKYAENSLMPESPYIWEVTHIPALVIAAGLEANSEDICSLLLKSKADANLTITTSSRFIRPNSALYVALASNKPHSLIKLLLNAGAKADNYTYVTLSSYNAAVLTDIISAIGIDNVRKWGNPLFRLRDDTDPKAIKVFTKFGFDINEVDSNTDTPLHSLLLDYHIYHTSEGYKYKKISLSLVKAMIEAGAKVKIKGHVYSISSELDFHHRVAEKDEYEWPQIIEYIKDLERRES